MLTKLIGVREFRQNMASFYEKAKKNNWRYIVLSHNQPMFKVEALDKEDAIVEKLAIDIEKAREDVKKGRVKNFEDVCLDLGL